MMRLVAIMLLFVMDNSEMERLFSLMNRMKGRYQYWLDLASLRDQIWWHKARSVYSVERWDSALNRIAVAWSSAKKRRLHERASNEAPAAPIVLQPMQPAELN